MTQPTPDTPDPLLIVDMVQPLPAGLTLVPDDSVSLDSLTAALAASGPVRASIKRIEQRKDQPGINLTFTMSIAPRAEGDRPSPPGFDPWRATCAEAASFEGGIQSPEFGDWAMAQTIEANRDAIESDGVTLLTTVDMVLGRGLTAPHWLSRAFTKRWRRFNAHEVRTLDEVFGHQPMDPRTQQAARRGAEQVNAVHRALCDAVQASPTQPIHGGFPFDEVGEAFGIGKTLCRELYRKAVDELGLQDIAELRRLLTQGAKPKARHVGSGKVRRTPGLKRRR